MRTEITRGQGSLYEEFDERLILGISYQIHEEFALELARWWGEFTFIDNIRMGESAQCIIQLEDGRIGRCRIKKMINRVIRGIPPRFIYHFSGNSPLK